MLPSPALVLIDRYKSAKADFSFGDLDSLVFAFLVLAPGAVVRRDLYGKGEQRIPGKKGNGTIQVFRRL